MQVRFEVSDDLPRWAMTDSLTVLGQADIAVPLWWTKDEARDQQIVRLLRFIAAYAASQSSRISTGQTLTYGWTTLRFSRQADSSPASANECLVVHELRAPFGGDDTAYVAGATQAIELVQVQERALQRNRITGVAEHPHRMHSAIVCTVVDGSTGMPAEPLVLERTEPMEPRDSGWVLRCLRSDHDHDDPSVLHKIHLLHLVTAYPVAFAYLAMPVGTAVMLSDQQVVVFAPGQDSGVVDAGARRHLP